MSHQSRARVWALCSVVLALAACGGGDGGGSGAGTPPPPPVSPPSPPPPASPPPAPEEFFVSATGAAGGSQRLVIADPAQPTPLRYSGLVSSSLEVFNLTFDSNMRRVAFGNPTMVFFIQSGALFQTSLRKSRSFRVQRISSLSSACSVDDWHPLSFSTGDDGWVQITEAGPDADCSTAADNRQAFVRYSTPVTGNATLLPSGVRILESLPDPATNTLVGFIASDTRATPSKLVLYGPSLDQVADVAGGTNGWSLQFLSFRPGAQLTTSAYVIINGSSLRQLDWSATSARLGGTRHVFSGTGASNAKYLSDSTAMYFVDGLAVHRIDAAGAVSTLATLSSTDGDTARLEGLTSGHVVVQQESTRGDAPQVFTIPKLGGTPLRLAPVNWVASVIGLSADEVIYATKPYYAITPALRRIRADGSNERQVNLGSAVQASQLVPVYSPTIPYLSDSGMDGVMWCEIPAGESSCPHNGTLKSYDIQSGAITTLGNLSHTGAASITSLLVRGWGYSGRPAVLTATTLLSTQPDFMADFYLVRPGTANSVVRLTTNIP